MSRHKKREAGFTAVEGIIILVIVLVIGAAGYLVYKSHHKAKSTTTTTTQTSSKSGFATSTTPSKPATTDPYAGWQTASLQYEKLSVKYPSSWKISNTSTAKGVTGTVTPGGDKVVLTSSTGLAVTIETGVTGIGDGPYAGGKLLSVTPMTTMGGNYYLGFSNGSFSDTTTTTAPNGCVGTTNDGKAGFSTSKNITVASGSSKPFNVVCMTYLDSQGNAMAKTVAAFEADASFNDAKLIIESLAY